MFISISKRISLLSVLSSLSVSYPVNSSYFSLSMISALIVSVLRYFSISALSVNYLFSMSAQFRFSRSVYMWSWHVMFLQQQVSIVNLRLFYILFFYLIDSLVLPLSCVLSLIVLSLAKEPSFQSDHTICLSSLP